MRLTVADRPIRGITERDGVPREFIPELIRLLREGKFPIEKLISFCDLADTEKAIDDSESGRIVKPAIRL